MCRCTNIDNIRLRTIYFPYPMRKNTTGYRMHYSDALSILNIACGSHCFFTHVVHDYVVRRSMFQKHFPSIIHT